MKKLSLLVFSAVMILSLSGCVTTNISKADFREAAESGTPENSVIFFGAYSDTAGIEWSQIDPDYPADYLKANDIFGSAYFCSAPVAPGSTYRLEFLQVKNVACIYSLNFKNLDIHVPQKPGLYYVGSFDGITAVEKSENKEISSFHFIKKMKLSEKSLLKKVLSNYKGTEWESVIRERMEEL